jgi:hypothetical protein
MLLAAWESGRTLVMVAHNVDLLCAALPPAKHADVRVLGLGGGRLAFDMSLADDGFATALSDLHGVTTSWVQVQGRRRLFVERR